MGETFDLDAGPRRWADQLLFNMHNEFTAHAAREETRDKHYQEAITDIRTQLSDMRQDLASIKAMIQERRGTVSVWTSLAKAAPYLVAAVIAVAAWWAGVSQHVGLGK